MPRRPAPAAAPPLLRRAVNAVVDRVAGLPQRGRLPAEAELATAAGVSRATIRRAVDLLARRGLLRRDRHHTTALRAPSAGDRAPDAEEPASRRDAFAAFFFAKLARGELRPGDRFSELELAREAGINTVPAREALLTIAAGGLVAKEPRRRWTVVRLDEALVDELFAYRALIEVAAARAAAALPAGDPLRAELSASLAAHAAAARQPRVDAFLALDEAFHRALLRATRNRFLLGQFATISTLIRYQLRASPVGERGMRLGLAEHPRVLRAVLDGDADAAEAAIRAHLASARAITLLAADGGR